MKTELIKIELKKTFPCLMREKTIGMYFLVAENKEGGYFATPLSNDGTEMGKPWTKENLSDDWEYLPVGTKITIINE